MDNKQFTAPKAYGSDSLRDGVITPLLQTLLIGLFSGLALAAILWGLFGWRPWIIKISVPFVPVMWFVSFVFLLLDWRSALERLLNQDLDNDGMVGKPPKLEPIEVIVSQDNGRAVDYIDLPASMEQLKALAYGLSIGRQFSVSAWTGAGAPFSRAEFEQLRDVMVSRGLAVWRNPHAQAQGVELTKPGKAVLKRFLSESLPSPTPGAK